MDKNRDQNSFQFMIYEVYLNKVVLKKSQLSWQQESFWGSTKGL